MARPDPIQYAERLYGAIRAANFSPISFLAFGNAIKEGVAMRNMPRIAAEPFMRVVGEMLDLEDGEETEEVIEAAIATGLNSDAREASSPAAPSAGQSGADPRALPVTEESEGPLPERGTVTFR